MFRPRQLNYKRIRNNPYEFNSQENHGTSEVENLDRTHVANPTQGEGYVELLDAGQGIFIGNALVSNRDGKCRLFARNATVDDIMLSVTPIPLYDFSRPSKALYN